MEIPKLYSKNKKGEYKPDCFLEHLRKQGKISGKDKHMLTLFLRRAFKELMFNEHGIVLNGIGYFALKEVNRVLHEKEKDKGHILKHPSGKNYYAEFYPDIYNSNPLKNWKVRVELYLDSVEKKSLISKGVLDYKDHYDILSDEFNKMIFSIKANV
jgi:hypothetical protein